MNNEKTEIVCVHAGIHDNEGANILSQDWENLQNSMNENGWTDERNNFLNNRIHKDVQGYGPDILWNRSYADNNFKCDKIPEEDPIVIVGHCTTSSIPDNLYRFGNNSGCEHDLDATTGRGCISIRCLDKKNNPKIVMVDTASSNAFRENKNNNVRPVEILKLSKNHLPYPFYKIDRLLGGQIVQDGTSPPVSRFQVRNWFHRTTGFGGRRKRTRRNKKTKRTTRRR
jgi:hypothetical protein